jgi:nicotinamidase-related amidase
VKYSFALPSFIRGSRSVPMYSARKSRSPSAFGVRRDELEKSVLQGPISPALQSAAPDAYKHRVKRVGIVNAWADPNFSGAIEATGRKNLIMGGVTTDICLVFPSISAVQLGYNVQAILDASGSSWAIQEEVTRQRVQQAGVVLTTTNTAIAELVQDWASPAGSELIQLLIASAPMMQPAF